MKKYFYFVLFFILTPILSRAQVTYFEDRDCDGFPSQTFFTSSSPSTVCKYNMEVFMIVMIMIAVINRKFGIEMLITMDLETPISALLPCAKVRYQQD